MRISLRAQKAIEWLKRAQNPDGGIAAWLDGEHRHKSYPEVTGYLIPTLLAYEEKELAQKCADWLVSIQHKDGSFDGLDGVPRTFDTGAIMEGIYAIGYVKEAAKAREWIESQRNPHGSLRSQVDRDTDNFYNMRVEGLLGNKNHSTYQWFDSAKQRVHYLAYGLEGMFNLGYDIKDYLEKLPSFGLMPAYVESVWDGTNESWKAVSGTDTTATAQIGVLRLKSGLPFDPQALYDLQRPDGGLPHDASDSRQICWAVKYFLDFERLYNAD